MKHGSCHLFSKVRPSEMQWSKDKITQKYSWQDVSQKMVLLELQKQLWLYVKLKHTKQAQEKGNPKWKITAGFHSKLMFSIFLNIPYRNVLNEFKTLWFFALVSLHSTEEAHRKTYTLNYQSQTSAKWFRTCQLSSEVHKPSAIFSCISTPHGVGSVLLLV